MMNSRAKKILLLVAAAALLTANGFLLPVLNRERAVLGITRIEPLENAPPMLALTTQVLGGFRGLIANALWIRANQLQQDGKYFEMVQLADWITKLEPHIAQVWVHQAWNMAFNISVKFTDHADRWRWVQRGMELLRDEGLRYNPDQVLIYAELAWLFQFKMGQNLDDAHFYYKGAWAAEMMGVFGGPTPDFEKLIHPQTPDEQARARALRERYKMDATKMRALDERYGPLDWRLPEAHSIYWAGVGLDRTKGEDVRRLRQSIYQSMNLSYQRGRLVLSSNLPPRLLPNLEIIPRVDAAFQEQWADTAANAAFLTNSVATAYRNWLRDVPYRFFLFNRVREGEQWLQYLRQKFPAAAPANLTLAEYAMTRASGNVRGQSHSKMTELLQALVLQSYYAVIDGRADDANEYMNRTSELWNAYTVEAKANQRLELMPLNEIKTLVLRDLLAPNSNLGPEERMRLITEVPGARQLVPQNAPAEQK